MGKKKFTIPDDPRKRELLLAAEAGRGRVGNVRALLDLGVDPNSRGDFGGFTAIGIAAAKGQAEVVRELLERNADPALLDGMGRNALMRCAENGDIGIAVMLLRCGLDPLAESNMGQSAVEIAHICENDDLAIYLWNESEEARQ
jgi:ankyrin repeat protein